MMHNIIISQFHKHLLGMVYDVYDWAYFIDNEGSMISND